MPLDTPSDAQNLKLQADAHGSFAQYEIELENAVFLPGLSETPFGLPLFASFARHSPAALVERRSITIHVLQALLVGGIGLASRHEIPSSQHQ